MPLARITRAAAQANPLAPALQENVMVRTFPGCAAT